MICSTTTKAQNPLTDESFRAALDAFVADQAAATSTYGPIGEWDVSQVTNFTNLGLNPDFTGDLSAWNVGNGVDMAEVRRCSV